MANMSLHKRTPSVSKSGKGTSPNGPSFSSSLLCLLLDVFFAEGGVVAVVRCGAGGVRFGVVFLVVRSSRSTSCNHQRIASSRNKNVSSEDSSFLMPDIPYEIRDARLIDFLANRLLWVPRLAPIIHRGTARCPLKEAQNAKTLLRRRKNPPAVLSFPPNNRVHLLQK